MGYRRSSNVGVATGSQPESVYAVASGTLASNACCFDFGNVEATSSDTGRGHMDALIVSTYCSASPCSAASETHRMPGGASVSSGRLAT